MEVDRQTGREVDRQAERQAGGQEMNKWTDILLGIILSGSKIKSNLGKPY
jgi:hypothetical protein